MTRFERLFGLKITDIKANCILTPFAEKELFNAAPLLSSGKGLLFDSFTNELFSTIVIKRGMLAHDAVLYLSETSCKKIFLFGSSAGIDPLAIGAKVIVKEAFNLESPSAMTAGRRPEESFFPDDELNNRYLQLASNEKYVCGKCATVGSLFQESAYKDIYSEMNICCIDMQSSGVFSAAKKTGIKAMACLYISDVINQTPFYVSLNESQRKQVRIAKRQIANKLIDLIENVRS